MSGSPSVNREILLPVPPELVWRALTEGQRLSAWFGAQVRFEPRPGAPATFRWPDGRRRDATVEEVEPLRKLSFRWAPFERTPGKGARAVPATRVEFNLEQAREGTLLRISERGLSEFALATSASVTIG